MKALFLTAALLAGSGVALAQEPPDLDVISRRAWDADQNGETRKARELHQQAIGICDRERSRSRNCYWAYIMASGAKLTSQAERAELLAKADAIDSNAQRQASILGKAQNPARSPRDRALSYSILLMYAEAVEILDSERLSAAFAAKDATHRLWVYRSLAGNLEALGRQRRDSAITRRAREHWTAAMRIARTEPDISPLDKTDVELATARYLDDYGEEALAFFILLDMVTRKPDWATTNARPQIVLRLISVCSKTSRWGCVETYSREHLANLARRSPDSSPSVFWAQSGLALALANQGKLGAARVQIRQAIAGTQELMAKQGDFDAQQQRFARETSMLHLMHIRLNWSLAR